MCGTLPDFFWIENFFLQDLGARGSEVQRLFVGGTQSVQFIMRILCATPQSGAGTGRILYEKEIKFKTF